MQKGGNVHRFLLCIMLVCLCVGYSNAQIVLQGTVTDQATSKPIEYASVVLKSRQSNKALQYTLTNPQGKFELKTNTLPDSAYLQVLVIGYATQQLLLNGKSQNFVIALIPQVINVKEVVVKANRIIQHNDTVNYAVSAFAEAQDRTIGDVMKKMPGVEVRNDGSILYNGQPINGFYIEGLNLLGGKYGMATNNISPSDVGSVQVLENHQPVKALKNKTFTDQAAINLTLKEGVKAKWTGSAKAGLGASPLLWLADLFAMRMAKQSQSLNMYKTNNMGENVSTQLKTQTIEDYINALENNVQQTDWIQVQPVAPPSLAENRTLFNRSQMLAVNNLWGLKKEYQLKANISYLNDRLTNDYEAVTVYKFAPDSTLVIDEQTNGIRHINKLNAGFTLTANRSDYYFNNTFKIDGVWNKTNLNTEGSSANTQQAQTPAYTVQNDFSLLKQFGKQMVKVSSFNYYLLLPQSLNVSATQGTGQRQTADLSTFFTHTNAAFSVSKKNFTFDTKAGIKFKTQQLDTELTGTPNMLGQLTNNIQHYYSSLYLTPKLTYNGEKVKLTIDLPVRYYHSYTNDRQQVQTDKNDYSLFTPSLSARINWTAHWATTLRAGYGSDLGDINRLYTGYILRNYRVISSGIPELFRQRRQSYSAGLIYRNTVNAFFASAMLLYSPSSVNQLSMQDFSGIYTINQITQQWNHSRYWMANARVSKGIDALRATISLDMSYNRTQTEMIQENRLIPYNSQLFTFSPQINARLTSWSNFEYKAIWQVNALKKQDGETNGYTPINQVNQTATLTVYPCSKLTMQLGVEYLYNEITAHSSANLFLADASLSYLLSKTLELRLAATNLFNEKTYTYTVYSELSSVSSRYTIRPANFLFSMYLKL